MLGERRLVSYRGVSFQLADLQGEASWKLAPRVNSHLPLASINELFGVRRRDSVGCEI